MTLTETIKEHIVIVVLGTAIGSFGSGWAAYKSVMEAGNQEPIYKSRKADLERKEGELATCQSNPKPLLDCAGSVKSTANAVDLLAIFNMGRNIANAEAAAPTAASSARDSLNGAIQNAERIDAIDLL